MTLVKMRSNISKKSGLVGVLGRVGGSVQEEEMVGSEAAGRAMINGAGTMYGRAALRKLK
jgi:hypothetical protein